MTSYQAASSPPPSRFTIYDSDLSSSYSDSEVDTDEWVTVSSSTTTSTISSLPQHLNLSLHPKTAPPRSSKASSFNGSNLASKPVFVGSSNIGTSKALPEPPKPVLALKKLLPKLSSVYVVNPERLPPAAWKIAKFNGTHVVQSEPKLRSQSPIELFNSSEYVRICARCAKPKMVVCCDGTWKMSSSGICDLHTPFMR